MKKILIADDAGFMRMRIKNMLNNAGYTDIYEAEDGQQALNIFIEKSPDLVFLDIIMPNMDGVEALQAILAHDPKAAVIMMSVLGDEGCEVDTIQLGAKAFLLKPMNEASLLPVVSNILG